MGSGRSFSTAIGRTIHSERSEHIFLSIALVGDGFHFANVETLRLSLFPIPKCRKRASIPVMLSPTLKTDAQIFSNKTQQNVTHSDNISQITKQTRKARCMPTTG